MKTLAFDFGASSGRAILGQYDGKKLELLETHRFSNDPVQANGTLYWDVLRLFHEIKQGIVRTVHEGHRDIASIGIDTWGVDFGLLDRDGRLLGNPVHYRDSRTDGMIDLAFQKVGRDAIFQNTGIEITWFNTIYQLLALVERGDVALSQAESLLLMPDLFNYFLTGEKRAEYTIASTTQLYDMGKNTWATGLMEQLGIPANLFQPIIHPGQKVGTLLPALAQELGVAELPVMAVGSHDTASAAMSVPATSGEDYAFISCGTWSIMGVEASEPTITQQSMERNYTNEGGVGSILTMKNIMGLWLIQECKRQWELDEGRKFSFDELEQGAKAAKPFASFVDPDDASFVAPNHMPERIMNYCKKTGQQVPETKGEIIRCIAQSLALKYRLTIENLESLLGRKLGCVHMVGGGIKDKMICQFTANATHRQVLTGPVEATAIGNNLAQLIAHGELKNIAEGRQLVADSFPVTEYQPKDVEDWEAAYDTFCRVIGK